MRYTHLKFYSDSELMPLSTSGVLMLLFNFYFSYYQNWLSTCVQCSTSFRPFEANPKCNLFSLCVCVCARLHVPAGFKFNFLSNHNDVMVRDFLSE